ncbi:MAG TPA: hypothetical protein VNT79_09970, partial [Phycisphaerae bacterium]|nr:hypothetical protein [Phycisphaerae bacterium]
MPRKNIVRKRRISANLTDDHAKILLTGRGDYFNEFGPLDAPETYAAKREAWECLRDELLPKWIEENPGSRPWAWWAFDAPERRRCTNQIHPFDDPKR